MNGCHGIIQVMISQQSISTGIFKKISGQLRFHVINQCQNSNRDMNFYKRNSQIMLSEKIMIIW